MSENKGFLSFFGINKEKPESVKGNETMAVEKKEPGKKPEKFFVAGREVIIEDRQIVPETKEEESELKEFVRQMINAPKLVVLDEKGRPVDSQVFDDWKRELRGKEEELIAAEKDKNGKEKVEKIIVASSFNYLTRVNQLGMLLGTDAYIIKHPNHDSWCKEFKRITGMDINQKPKAGEKIVPVDTEAYNRMSVEDKEKLSDNLNDLILDIYKYV